MPMDKAGKYHMNPVHAKAADGAGKPPAKTGSAPEPSPDHSGGEPHSFLTKMHAEHGGKHMHIHSHEDGGHTTHHIHEDGEVQGPHEHPDTESMTQHVATTMGDDMGMGEPDGDEMQPAGHHMQTGGY